MPTVAALKEALAALGLDTKGKKAVLEARLAAAQENEEKETQVASVVTNSMTSENTQNSSKVIHKSVPDVSATVKPVDIDASISSSVITTCEDKQEEDPAVQATTDISVTEKANDVEKAVEKAVDPTHKQRSISVAEPDAEDLDYSDDTDEERGEVTTDSARIIKRTASSPAPTAFDGEGKGSEQPSKRRHIEDDSGDAREAIKKKEWLVVTKFKRPFSNAELRGMLEEYGEIADEKDSISTDRYKTCCYVKYTTSEARRKALIGLAGRKWPLGHGQVRGCEARILVIWCHFSLSAKCVTFFQGIACVSFDLLYLHLWLA